MWLTNGDDTLLQIEQRLMTEMSRRYCHATAQAGTCRRAAPTAAAVPSSRGLPNRQYATIESRRKRAFNEEFFHDILDFCTKPRRPPAHQAEFAPPRRIRTAGPISRMMTSAAVADRRLRRSFVYGPTSGITASCDVASSAKQPSNRSKMAPHGFRGELIASHYQAHDGVVQ